MDDKGRGGQQKRVLVYASQCGVRTRIVQSSPMYKQANVVCTGATNFGLSSGVAPESEGLDEARGQVLERTVGR